MLETSNACTITGYTWSDLHRLFLALQEGLEFEGAASFVLYVVRGWMRDIENAEEYYFMHHAFPLIAARTRHASLIEIKSVIDTREWYRMISTFLCNPLPHYTSVHDLMKFLHKESQRNLTIPAATRDLLGNIIDDYDTQNRYQEFANLRQSLLLYIDTTRKSHVSPATKTQIIQACCYILSLFH